MNVLELLSLFAKDRKLAILAGAGISLDSPSNLLDGYAFMSQVLKRIKLEDIPDEWILGGLQKPTDGPSRPGEFLRFELMMKALQDSGLDEELRVLDCLGDCDRPNRNHFIIADLLHAGSPILTTNFDCLIEHAYEQLNPGDWPALRVVVYDKEFSSTLLEEDSVPTLWKLHGSLKRDGGDTRDSLEATMTAVLARTQDGNKYRLLADVLRKRDVLVLGYSGWDDFDVVPLIAGTRSDTRLIWVDHNSQVNGPGVLTGTEVLEEIKQDSHVEWESDTVGRNRVFFNVDQDGKQVREPRSLKMIRGLTSTVLDIVSEARLLGRSYPLSNSEFLFGRAYPQKVELYFQNWAANSIVRERPRYAFIKYAFELRIRNRNPEIEKLIDERLAATRDSESDSMDKRLRELTDSFNTRSYILPRNETEARQLEGWRLQVEALFTDLTISDAVVALRLLGCINYKLEGSRRGDEFFQRSADLARTHEMETAELSTLLNWLQFWRSSLGDGTSSFSTFSEAEVEIRIKELEDTTGYLPLVASDELNNDLGIYLDEYNLHPLIQRTRRLRRHSVDVGDLWGEALCSLRLAHLFREAGDWTGTAIELLRLEELEKFLKREVPRYWSLASLGSWDGWAKAEERDDLSKRVRASMWQTSL
jgi:SIR2-like protein